MKNLIAGLAFVVAFCFSNPSGAQDIFYSKEQKFSFQNSDFSVIGWSGDRLYTYRASKEGYYLDAYNDSMRMMATIALDFFPQKIYETKFVNYDDQILVFYQAIQRSYVIQYMAKLDAKARLMQKPVALDSVKMAWFGSDKKYYSYAVSSDKSKIMIFGLGNRKDKQIHFNTILLDNNLNVLARGNPYLERDNDISLGQVLLGNDGTMYMSAYSESGSKSFSGDAWLFNLSADGKVFRHAVLPLDRNYISGMFIRLDDRKNEIYVGAFYSGKRSGNLDGVVYGHYSPLSDTVSFLKLIPFDDKLRNATDDRNKKKAFNDYEVRNVIVKNDGGFILVAENFYITTRTAYNSGYGYYSWYYNGPYMSSSTREYHYGDILAVAYDASGNRTWHSFIRKEQYSQEDGGLFSSYAMLNSGASLVFLYNDFSTTKSTLNLAALDADGNLQLKKMNPGKASGADWLPRSAKQTDSRELIVPVLRKNSLGFARLAF
jgi:hypothetical protein